MVNLPGSSMCVLALNGYFNLSPIVSIHDMILGPFEARRPIPVGEVSTFTWVNPGRPPRGIVDEQLQHEHERARAELG